VVQASQSDGNKLNTARAEMGLDHCQEKHPLTGKQQAEGSLR